MNLPISDTFASALSWALIHALWQWTLIGLIWYGGKYLIFKQSSLAAYWGGIFALAAGTITSMLTFWRLSVPSSISAGTDLQGVGVLQNQSPDITNLST